MALPTSPVVHWTSKAGTLVFISLLLLSGGCAVLEKPLEPPPSFAPREEVYFQPFDKVWRAANLALQKYPMKINNMDKGLLETDTIKPGTGWKPAHRDVSTNGRKYYLSVRVIKGNLNGRPANKVTIYKYTEFQKDFFAPVEKLPSDGWEEKSILYRIHRELDIERALSRAAQRQNSH